MTTEDWEVFDAFWRIINFNYTASQQYDLIVLADWLLNPVT